MIMAHAAAVTSGEREHFARIGYGVHVAFSSTRWNQALPMRRDQPLGFLAQLKLSVEVVGHHLRTADAAHS
jgi:hypothetical protein